MTDAYQKLEQIIRQTRRRMRVLAAVRGLAACLAVAAVVLVLAAIAVDYWNYAEAALLLARVASIAALLAAVGWFLVRPLLRRVSDPQIARFIEEKRPEIQDRLVSAVELAGKEESRSNPLLPLLFSDAERRVRPVQPKALFNRREPWLSGLISLAFLIVFALLFAFGPGFLPYSASRLYADWLNTQPASLYAIEVTPGNIVVPKGADQPVAARLVGFDASEVLFFSRYESNGKWEQSKMAPDSTSGGYAFLFLDMNDSVRYYVQAGRVRSPEFGIQVKEAPEVEKINLVYHYPAYTGLPDQRENDTGDITALKGTEVQVEVITNLDTTKANLALADGSKVALKRIAPRKLLGQLKVTKDSSYQVRLADAEGIRQSSALDYSITALNDQPPQVSLTKPGRDKKVTKLEEVLTELKADDDLGLKSLELRFSVNGGEEQSVSLFQAKNPSASKSISGTHTFFMEEYDLEPGDFVTYYGRARDAVSSAESDIYFLEVRPFGKEYSQSQVSSGNQAGAGNTDTVLSARQKEILSATWRLARGRKDYDRKKYADDLKVVADSQRKLQEEARSLSERIVRRALLDDEAEFAKLSENLRAAIEAMTPAYERLSNQKPDEAIRPEKTALQHLMRAESLFRDIQVAYGSPSSGAGNQSEAQELENLFELELDQLKNQYETLQQRQNQQAGSEIDEARRRLEELARRQQQLNERRRQAASRFAQSGAAARSDQAQLQEEAQKLARQLERLSRETQNEELMQASRRLQQAARDMQNSSSQSQQGQAGSQSSQGIQALNRLNDAQRMMDRLQESSLNDQVRRLRDQAGELARKQDEIRSNVERLAENAQRDELGNEAEGEQNSPGQQDPRAVAQRLSQAKNELKEGVSGLQNELADAARRAAAQDKGAGARGLQSASNRLRDAGLPRRIDQGRDMLRRGLVDFARQREEGIQQALEELKSNLEEAQNGLAQQGSKPGSSEQKLEEALNRTGDLVSDLESLEQRARERMSSSQSEQAGGNQQPKGEQPGQQGSGQARGAQQGASGDPRQLREGAPAGGRDAVNFGERPPAGALSAEQLRQFDREFGLRYKEAQQLGRDLGQRPDLAAQVQDLLRRMKGMPPSEFLQDKAELDRMRASIIEGFRQLELKLSQALNQLTSKDHLRLVKDEAIPEAYRKQVEEYYRALAETKPAE